MGMFDRKNSTGQAVQKTAPASTKRVDAFDKIGDADASERSVYPIPGVYPLLYCERLKMIQSKLSGDDMFIAEFTILDSNVDSRPKGTSMSWVCNLRHLPSPGNIRSFLAALNDTAVEEVDAEGARVCCSDENPCRGRLVRLEAAETATKAGTPFTICKWISIPEAVQVKAEEKFKALTDVEAF